MTDTPRTHAEIQALFANNTSGQISPQDLRDFVESVANPVSGGGFEAVQHIVEMPPTRMDGTANDIYGPFDSIVTDAGWLLSSESEDEDVQDFTSLLVPVGYWRCRLTVYNNYISGTETNSKTRIGVAVYAWDGNGGVDYSFPGLNDLVHTLEFDINAVTDPEPIGIEFFSTNRGTVENDVSARLVAEYIGPPLDSLPDDYIIDTLPDIASLGNLFLSGVNEGNVIQQSSNGQWVSAPALSTYHSNYQDDQDITNDVLETIVWDSATIGKNTGASPVSGGIYTLGPGLWLMTFTFFSLDSGGSYPGSDPTYFKLVLPGSATGSGDHWLTVATGSTWLHYTTLYFQDNASPVAFPVKIMTNGPDHIQARLQTVKLV